jgi:hypothetical protein
LYGNAAKIAAVKKSNIFRQQSAGTWPYKGETAIAEI